MLMMTAMVAIAIAIIIIIVIIKFTPSVAFTLARGR